MFRIGDKVTPNQNTDPRWDGTVVDMIDIKQVVVRVYWRYPLGRVSDHYGNELVRVV